MRQRKLRVVEDRNRVSISIILLYFAFIFAVIAFLIWLFLDVGIADRVVITLTILPIMIAAVVKTVASFGERRKGRY